MDHFLQQTLTKADLSEVKGGTMGEETTLPFRPHLVAKLPVTLASLPVLPHVPPWIEEAIGAWAGSMALEYGRAFLSDTWDHRVESTAQALPPMAMRPLAERTHRWLN